MVTTKDETYDTINGDSGKGCPFFDNEARLDSCCRLNVFANRQAFFRMPLGRCGANVFQRKKQWSEDHIFSPLRCFCLFQQLAAPEKNKIRTMYRSIKPTWILCPQSVRTVGFLTFLQLKARVYDRIHQRSEGSMIQLVILHHPLDGTFSLHHVIIDVGIQTLSRF